MPLIKSEHTDRLLARCWHETPSGEWYRDDTPPCSLRQAIDTEDAEERARDAVIARDPSRGGTPTTELHDRPAYFDDATGLRIGSKAYQQNEEARVYEVNGEVLVGGNWVKAERLVRR